MSSVFDELHRASWTATRRTIPRPARLPGEVLERAESLFDSGQYKAAQGLLTMHHETIVVEDARALNLLAMATWAAGPREGDIGPVEDRLDEATAAAKRLLAGTEINRATLYKASGQLAKGLAAAIRARDLAPGWYPTHLAVLALLEYMREDDDSPSILESIREAVAQMETLLVDPRLRVEILEDPDYLRLRKTYSLEQE